MRGARSFLRWTLAVLGLLATTLAPAAFAQAPAPPEEIPEGFFDALEYRHIGPVGNRVPAVVGEPGNANVYYAGAASGGVWKSTDGGVHWAPVFDEQDASSIGAIAVAPSDPNVVWVGTGEAFIRANISIGNGVYRSTDKGEHWQHLGLEKTGRIARILVHPKDPDVALVCALGHIYGPQEERGVYRTEDGGTTWQRTLFVDPDTGCSDLALDETNPRRVFAGMWQIEVNTWNRTSGGPGSSLWSSRDGGKTWEKLESSGLPEPPWGKIGLTTSASDPDRVYALIETSTNRDFAPSDPFQGVLWRSDNGGDSWTMVNASNDLVARPLYYSRALASPDDADEVYFMAPRHQTSLDGGTTHFQTENQPGWDHHDMWIDPKNPDRMIVGHDGGVSISTNQGRSWHRPQLPIAQMYHVAVDDRIPYFVYGNRQDGPSMRGPSNTLTGGSIPIGAWHSVGGCEVGFTVPDPERPNLVWTGCYDGLLDLYDLDTGHSRDVSVWPVAVESWPAEDLKYRFQWTFPLALSPHDSRKVYAGSQHVHRTTDGGQSWEIVSPDLTSDDPELQQRTGGLTLDDAGPTIAPVVFALAVSPVEEGVIWAGTNDGHLKLSRDDGDTWTDVTPNLPADIPPRGTISNVEPSPHAAATAYVTIDRHQLGDTEPYVLKTTDHGRTFTRIDDGIPRSVFSYAHCVREDPVRPGLLFLGTENALYVSFDDGTAWHPLRSGLPPAPVHWLTIQERFADLAVATYGRGFYILDDITPLRHLSAETFGGSPILLPPRPAYRFRYREAPVSQPGDPAAGTNPEYGASLHVVLPEGIAEDAEITLEILDAAGELVRELDPPSAEAGLHRLVWDLRTEETREVKLRTKPDENPHVAIPDEGFRDFPDGHPLSLLSPPGTYTVRLSVGEEMLTAPLEILKDPRSKGTLEDIEAQTTLLRDLWQRTDRSAATINEIEWLRKQLVDLRARLEDTDRDDIEEIVAAAEALEEDLKAVEGEFFDLRLTNGGQDQLRFKRLLHARLGALARSVGQSDFAPTEQQLEVHAMLAEQLERHAATFETLRTEELTAFNALLREKGVPNVIPGSAPEMAP